MSADERHGLLNYLRGLKFLGFAILPFAILIVMNFSLDYFIRNIGGDIAGGGKYSEIFAPPPGGSLGPIAIARGRFEWMAFFLAALILYPAVAVVALRIMYRNLSRSSFSTASLLAMTMGIGWWMLSLGGKLEKTTGLLLMPTKRHALSAYDAAFAEAAWRGVRLNYGAALVVTVLIIVAAASVMNRVGKNEHASLKRLTAKRRDLKLVIVTASILMTFIAIYVGEWLSWPARLATSGDTSSFVVEFRSFASGLRLYFGTGYSLALLGFAIPAVLTMSRAFERAGLAAEEDEDDNELLPPFVFTKTEFGLLSAVMTPFLSALVGSAIQL